MLMTIPCHPPARRISPLVGALAVATFLIAILAFASTASAAGSSTGELAFYPCTDCHPVVLGANGKPITPLPKDFKQHTIELEVHDVLGTDGQACRACHDDPAANPGKLVLPDGSLVDITGDISRVCQRCHFEKYREWEDGIHGKDAPKCSSAGCHDPHTPSWIYMEALPPFQGTGVEIRAVSDREPFKPLAGPPVAPPVHTPLWLVIVTVFGGLSAAGIISYLTLGRPKR